MNCDDNTKAEDLAKLKKCLFKLIFKIEHNYDKEKKVFSNAIHAFVKTAENITEGSDARIVNAWHTFGKETVQSSNKRRRKNSGKIPVQHTAKSRRRIQHRG